MQNVNTLTTADGTKVGYMQFNSFISIAQPELISAVNKFKADNIDELVIDLRYNGGGLLVLSSQLAYMVAGPANTDDFYYYQTFRTTNSHKRTHIRLLMLKSIILPSDQRVTLYPT